MYRLADLYRDQRLPSCQIVAVSPCGRRWQQFAGVAPPGKDRRPPPRAGGPATPLTSRRESRAADANLFASESCSLSLEPLRQIWMPKRTPRRRRASVSGASPERAPEPEAEPETEFGTPTATADVGAELAEVRANQAATATALETLLTQVASLTSAVAAAAPWSRSRRNRLPTSDFRLQTFKIELCISSRFFDDRSIIDSVLHEIVYACDSNSSCIQ